LRCHNDAQPEIQTLATMMELALDQNIPQELRPGEWHLPFITWKDWAKAAWGLKTLSNEVTQAVLKTSVARCARISYLNHNGKVNSIQQDIAFTDKLWRDGHLSPFEHQGRALNTEDHLRGVTSYDMRNNIWSGNFKTFVQYRHYGNDR
ncbi:MAG: hypothetical protein KAI07_00630, partial [Deltaproteobacteria bacterium]|nr:hypothetical protein [Deltaproteobacteria bacterium]